MYSSIYRELFKRTLSKEKKKEIKPPPNEDDYVDRDPDDDGDADS